MHFFYQKKVVAVSQTDLDAILDGTDDFFLPRIAFERFANSEAEIKACFYNPPRFICIEVTAVDPRTERPHKMSVWIPIPYARPVIPQFIQNKEIKEGEKIRPNRTESLLPCVCPYPSQIEEGQLESQFFKFNVFMELLWLYNDLTAKGSATAQEVSVVNKAMKTDLEKHPELIEQIDRIFGEKIYLRTGKTYAFHIKTMSHDFYRCAPMLMLNGDPLSHHEFGSQIKEFLGSCSGEKLKTRITSIQNEERLLSGGCPLMVSGLAQILGIPEDELYGTPLKDKFTQLMRIMGAANVEFNDPVSANKEAKNREELDPPYKEGEFEPWAQEKIFRYHQCIYDFFRVKNEIKNQLDEIGLDDRLKTETKRYVMLIEASLSAVQLWSVFLTRRYFFDREDYVPSVASFYANGGQLTQMVCHEEARFNAIFETERQGRRTAQSVEDITGWLQALTGEPQRVDAMLREFLRLPEREQREKLQGITALLNRTGLLPLIQAGFSAIGTQLSGNKVVETIDLGNGFKFEIRGTYRKICSVSYQDRTTEHFDLTTKDESRLSEGIKREDISHQPISNGMNVALRFGNDRALVYVIAIRDGQVVDNRHEYWGHSKAQPVTMEWTSENTVSLTADGKVETLVFNGAFWERFAHD